MRTVMRVRRFERLKPPVARHVTNALQEFLTLFLRHGLKVPGYAENRLKLLHCGDADNLRRDVLRLAIPIALERIEACLNRSSSVLLPLQRFLVPKRR